MKKWQILILIPGFLVGCSSGSDDGPKNLGGLGTGSAKQFNESYSFKLEEMNKKCETGKQHFSSDISYEDVVKKLCTALQDDELNQSCAEEFRKELFQKKCVAATWSPKYAPAAGNPSPKWPPAQNVDEAKFFKPLEFLLVEKFEIPTGLAGDSLKMAQLLANSIVGCGLHTRGPSCLDSAFTGQRGPFVVQANGQTIVYSEMRREGSDDLFALVFKVGQTQPTLQLTSVDIFKILKTSKNLNLPTDLKERSLFLPLLQASLSADVSAAARNRLQNPKDIRQLFHFSQRTLMDAQNKASFPSVKNEVARAIVKNRQVIIQSKNERYLEEIFHFAGDVLAKKDLIDLGLDLINSAPERIKQLAAVKVLRLDPTHIELKPIVIRALKSKSWSVRNEAIKALASIELNLEEENILVGLIADADEDVRRTAVSFVAAIEVTENHLVQVQQISESGRWEVRIEAAKLLSRIGSTQAVSILIGMMNDVDEDVRRQVSDQLRAKNLTDAHIELLGQQMNSGKWEVRNEAVKILGRAATDSAILILIRSMDDADEDVRTAIEKNISLNMTKEIFIGPLVEQYKSTKWKVRFDVSALIARFPTPAVTDILISQMDDADEDVRQKIRFLLSSRPMTEQATAALQAQFSSRKWDVRKEVAKQLGRIKSADSLAALEAQLTKESDEDVKTQIKSSIRAQNP